MMHRALLVSVLVLVAAAPAQQPPTQVAPGDRVARAIAIMNPPQGQQNMAFCIDESGFFVTTYNAILVWGGVPAMEVKLQLNPDGREVAARVASIDASLDLAILYVEGEKGLTALPLNGTKVPSMPARVSVFTMRQKASVLPGDKRLEPGLYRLDAQVIAAQKSESGVDRFMLSHRGDQDGGPALDAQGTVIGIYGRDVIPLTSLRSLLAGPEVSIDIPPVAWNERYAPAEFTVHLRPLADRNATFDLELGITDPGGGMRKVAGKITGAGTVKLKVAPLVKSGAGSADPGESDHVDFNLAVRTNGELATQRTGVLPLVGAKTANDDTAEVVGWRAPRLTQDLTSIPLDGVVWDACLGGNGRYLVLYFLNRTQLAIFDLSLLKMVGTIPLDSDDIRFAAGRDKVIVSLVDKIVFQRWDLATCKREAEAPQPVEGVVQQIVMGCDATGPLLVRWAENTQKFAPSPFGFVDASTLKKLEVRISPRANFSTADEFVHLRATPRGDFFTGWPGDPSNPTRVTIHYSGNRAYIYHETFNEMHLLPLVTAEAALTGTGSIFSPRLTRLTPEIPFDDGTGNVPSVQDARYLSLAWDGKHRAIKQATVMGIGNSRPIAMLPALAGMEVTLHRTGAFFTYDKRILFFPQSKFVVTIPESDDRLVIHRFDTVQVLEQLGIDYLFVDPVMPRPAQRGVPYRYPIVVRSKRGGVNCVLSSGPAGLKLSPTGVLEWTPPAFAVIGREAGVTVKISDASGQTITQRISIPLR